MSVLAIGWPGPGELIIIAIIALLLFGSRLPEVGRSVGRTIVQFKKGLKETQDEIEKDIKESDNGKPA